MLLNSFSYLPIYASARGVSPESPTWWLVSDRAVAHSLLSAGGEIKRRSVSSVLDAWTKNLLQLEKAPLLSPEDDLTTALAAMGAGPGLVVDPKMPAALWGIATPFDLL